MIICKYGSPTITGILRPGSIKNWLTSNNFLQIAPYKKLQMVISFNPYCIAKLYIPLKWPTKYRMPIYAFSISTQATTIIWTEFPRWKFGRQDVSVDGKMTEVDESTMQGLHLHLSVGVCASLSSEFLSFPQWFGCISTKPWSCKGWIQPPIWVHQHLMIFSKLPQMLQISATRTYRVGSCRSS